MTGRYEAGGVDGLGATTRGVFGGRTMTARVEEQNPLERKNGSNDSVKKQVLQKGGCDGSHNPG
jgi:hypothetical protein